MSDQYRVRCLEGTSRDIAVALEHLLNKGDDAAAYKVVDTVPTPMQDALLVIQKRRWRRVDD